MLFHRLEHICYCVEHNEWPFPKRMSYIPMNYDSRSGTPVGSSTPKDDPELSQSDAGDSVYDGVKVKSDLNKDFEAMMPEVGHRLVYWLVQCWVFFVYWFKLWLIGNGTHKCRSLTHTCSIYFQFYFQILQKWMLVCKSCHCCTDRS